MSSNRLDAEFTFKGRKDYKEKYLQGKLGKFDFWYDDVHYGRQNLAGDPIVLLKASVLKSFKSKKTLFAVDFVVDAFEDMKKYHDRHIKDLNVGNVGPISRISPIRAWTDPEALFQKHLTFMKNFFLDEYLHRDKDKIISFDDFMKYVSIFHENHGDTFPLMFSNYIKSSNVSINVTGLSIEVMKGKHGEDKVKKEILESNNFNFYHTMAKKFGFSISKNAPWAFVANMKSRRMMQYAEKYCILSQEEFYDEYFMSAWRLELDLLREWILDAYYSFLQNNPHIRKTYITCQRETKAKIFSRPVDNENNIRRGDQYSMIPLYIDFKLREKKLKISKKDLQRMKQNSIIVYEKQTLDQTLKFINSELDKYL